MPENDEKLTATAEDTAADTAAAGASVEDSPEPAADSTRKENRAAARAARKEKRRRRKETKKLRREYERRMKTVPVNKRPIVCPPDRAVSGTGRIVAGYIARALIIVFASFAVTFFVCDAFGLREAGAGNFGAGRIFLYALLFTAITAAASLIKYRVPAVAGGIVAIAGIILLGLLPDPAGAVWQAPLAAYNAALEHMTAVGYLAMYEKEYAFNMTAGTVESLVRAAVMLFTAFISVLYTVCLIRRIRVWQLIVPGVVSAGILWLVFTYNISRSNWGVVLIIASFAALLVMFVFDRTYVRAQPKGGTDENTGTSVFPDREEPELPESLAARRKARLEKADRKALKAEEKLRRAELRKKKRKVGKKDNTLTVDEELSDYFSAGKKKKNRSGNKAEKAGKTKKPKLTTAEKKAEKERKKAEKAAAREEKRKVAAYLGYKRRVVDARCAMGGFAGIGMFALAMVMLIIPALSVHDSFHTVKAVDKKFDYIREYVTAILMGDDPALDLLSYENNSSNFAPRTTEPHAIYYTGKPVMQVESNSRYNTYLRGWIATGYNDETGCWETASPDSETMRRYRSLFGTTIDPSETLMYSFYTAFDPDAIPSASERDYSTKTNSHTADGYVVTQINMKRLELDSKLLYMPSYNIRAFNVAGKTLAGKPAVFLRLPGTNEASKITYADFFDGLYTSYRASRDKDGYATVAMVPTMKISSFYRNMADSIADFNNTYAAVVGTDGPVSGGTGPTSYSSITLYDGTVLHWHTEYRTSEGMPSGRFVTNAEGVSKWVWDPEGGDGNLYIVMKGEIGDYLYTVLPSGSIRKSTENIPDELRLDADGNEIVYPVPDLPLAVRYYTLMTEEEQNRLKYAYNIQNFYAPFVYSVYTGKSSSAIVSELTDRIISEATVTEYEEYEETDPETGEVYTLSRPIKVPADFSRAAEKNTYLEHVDNSSKNKTTSFVPKELVTDSEVYRQRHRLVMEFINYLVDEDHYTYSLTPSVTADTTLVGVEKFLAGDREGSCVQFATSLVLMLRNAGIPARFVDGLIASNFYTNYNPDKVAQYITTVRDSNAHAWVEVWYDGIGWVQYEATPVYYDAMYQQQSSSSQPGHSSSGNTSDSSEDETDETDTMTDEELAELIRQQQEAERRERIRKIVTVTLIVLAVIALLALVFFYFYVGARKAERDRNALAERLAHACDAGSTDIPSGDDVRRMHGLVTLMLDKCGLAPRTGEFRDEYAARIASHNPGALIKPVEEEKLTEQKEARFALRGKEVSEVFDGFAAEEFGYGADVSSMPLMSRFFRRMYAYEYKRHVNPITRIRLWLFEHKL